MSDEVRLVAVSEHDLRQMGAFAEIIDWDAGITEEELELAFAGDDSAERIKLRAAFNSEEGE